MSLLFTYFDVVEVNELGRSTEILPLSTDDLKNERISSRNAEWQDILDAKLLLDILTYH